ncbi:hypothetical protein ACHMW7_08330 [Aminobacter sp. UC22_36]|uniref:hypothetical protein n=1 Tax=Aminobacter sp. UC22_36 TaxID=3374549 RepID=UPI0037581D38
MDSLATQLKTKRITANVFHHTISNAKYKPLVIDAFDELAKVDASGIYKLLGKAVEAQADRVILSSRSSEWDNSCTQSFAEFFDTKPLVVRLTAFIEAEQKLLFDHHIPGEDFHRFQAEVSRFDLEQLLPNPQFLTLFADAYSESNRCFKDKISIFELAVDRLAKETNTSVSQKREIPFERKIALAADVFTKLLLSGSEGVSSSDVNSDRMYPRLASLIVGEASIGSILATRLFKPGDKVGQHQPMHKIVSEYCAATYLIKRITDPTDALSLPQCLAIIAPNSTVRDELRGLLGWMAALGNKHIQEAAIDLDPYAVLANGDPSRLLPTSKCKLIHRLKSIAKTDPYFRRSDIWRTFSAAGFFTEDVVSDIKPLLTEKDENGHLRWLILELLVDSKAIPLMSNELRELVLAPQESNHTRTLASQCLLGIQKHDHKADLAVLIFEATRTSLNIAAKIMEGTGIESFEKTYLAGFLRICANLYPPHAERFDRTIGDRYFVKRFVSILDLPTVDWLLHNLTHGLSCKCGKKSYECDCRNGTSKIVGSLLDRFFELSSAPFDPKTIWKWVQNLKFHESKGPDQSTAVRVLRQDDTLRQGIIALAFEHETDGDRIFEIKVHQFDRHCHSGLFFQQIDYRFIVDLAFSVDNTALWSRFIARHQRHRDKKVRGPDDLRHYMKQQAREKPVFMQKWAETNRAAERFERENRIPSFRLSRRIRRRDRQQIEIRAANIKYVQDNKELVEGGEHWSCLARFAELVLMQPDKIEHEFGDEKLVRSALRNCLDFIEPHVPSLQRLAELQCQSQGLRSETILYAACLEIMRTEGSLKRVKPTLLAALRTNINMGYSAVTSDERELLKTETDKHLFATPQLAEAFLRNYVEPQLCIQRCNNPQVGLLRYDEAFKPLQPSLPIEWLTRFYGLPFGALDELFELAAQFGETKKLEEIISIRCAEFMFFWPDKTENNELEQIRTFWFVRALHFLPNAPRAYWEWLKADKDTVLILDERSGRINRSEHPYWPLLSAGQIEAILDAFIDVWPKVDLPNHSGSDSPKEEKAYRFLTEAIWNIGKCDPDTSLPVLDRLLGDTRFADMHQDLRSIRASEVRKKALRNFQAPDPIKLVALLEKGEIATVEGLRAMMLDELQKYQADLIGSETTSKDVFYKDYKKGERLGEVAATLRIADRIRLRLEDKGVSVTPEHQLQDAKRCDFTCTKFIDNHRRLLVVEVKGQWHEELYTAASKQLHERYSIHPHAEQQGIYLVLWFGAEEKVAGKKNTFIENADHLKQSIEGSMPSELKGLVDVFVLDVSKA